MKRIVTVALLLYGVIVFERFLVHFPRASMTFDSLYYTLASVRFSEGNFLETFSGPWQPLLGWCAGILVFLGVSPIIAVALFSSLGVGLAVWAVVRLGYGWGGALAGLLAGVGLASDPQVLMEAPAVRSDGIFVGLSTFAFWGMASQVQGQRIHRLLPLICGIGVVLVALRVAALPLAIWIGIWLILSVPSEVRLKSAVIYFSCVGIIVVAFCVFYFQKFGVFIPSLNFVLNDFYRITEWMRADSNGFCRLYDGQNTVLGDLQFLDPLVTTLPKAGYAHPSAITAFKIGNFFRTVELMMKIVAPWIWGLALFGAWQLHRKGKHKLLVLGVSWILVACGPQILSTAQNRFCLPAVPLLYALAGLGASFLIPKKTAWVATGIVILNLWMGRIHMNTGFLLSGTFLNKPEIAGDYLRDHYGPGHRVISIGLYPSLVAAAVRWRAFPCESPQAIREYIKRKRIEFVLLPKPLEHVIDPELQNFMKNTQNFYLEHETEYELVYHVK